MFLVCNYLDVERTDSRTDGFVVEECGKYDESLSDLVVVCREHRIANVKEWAHSQMGNKADLFEKQFKINPTKAMTFVRLKGNISSFTEEMVLQAGGVEQFNEFFNVKRVTKLEEDKAAEEKESTEKVPVGEVPVKEVPVEEVPVKEVPVKEVPVEQIIEDEVAEDNVSIANTLPLGGIEEAPVTEHVSDEVIEQTVAKVPVEEVPVQEVPIQEVPVQVAPVQEVVHRYVAEHPQCHTICIYNPDGTFKGFTEGQILTMLDHLHSLDKRIALDSLNPKYVLSSKELDEASSLLDSISPSVFKAFILYEASQAESETDRIRISSILDRFSSYMSTMQV